MSEIKIPNIDVATLINELTKDNITFVCNKGIKVIISKKIDTKLITTK